MEALKSEAENILPKVKESRSYAIQASEMARKLEEDLQQQKDRIPGNYLNQTTWMRYILYYLGWIGKDLKADLTLAEKGIEMTQDIIRSLFDTRKKLTHYGDQLGELSVCAHLVTELTIRTPCRLY
jgi:hypothetical protein